MALLFLGTACATASVPSRAAGKPSLTLIRITHLRGPIDVVEDNNIFSENSVFYVGPRSVTLIGTGWSPAIASMIHRKIRGVTPKPVSEVVDTDFNPERAGGNAYWKRIGAEVLSTALTASLLRQRWARQSIETRADFPDYPDVPLSLPTRTFSGDFSLQGGRVKEFYLGPSHTVDDIFVYFPAEKVLYAGNILKDGSATWLRRTCPPMSGRSVVSRLFICPSTTSSPGTGHRCTGRN